MLMIVGILTSALVGMLLVGFSYSGANTTTWGILANANLPLYAGILLIVLALGGGVYRALNR